MTSTHAKQQNPYREGKHPPSRAAYQAPSAASRKYLDYFAMSSSPQSGVSSARPDIHRTRKTDIHSSTADSILRGLVKAPPAGCGCEDYPSNTVPRAFPVPPSPRNLDKQGTRPYHSHSNLHSFDYYKTTNRRAPPPSALMTSSSTHEVSARYRESHPRHGDLLQQSLYQSSFPSQAPLRRSGLECTVCGPGAVGPWRRGPIGPYTLCNSCAKIEWQENDISVSLTIHEALSLLDNMRLIRLASVTRKLSVRFERIEEELRRRLQNGLPESTYARAEDLFARQEQVKQSSLVSNTAPQPSQSASKIAVHPPSDEDVHVGHKRGRSEDDFQQYEDGYRPTKYTARQPISEQSRPLRRDIADNKLLAVQEEIAGLSPQSIAVAALIGHRGPAQSDTRSPLTPSRAHRTSNSDKDHSNERMAVKTPIKNLTCESLSTELSGSKAEESPPTESSDNNTPRSLYAKPFPFRREDTYAEEARSRIIDRRRARNEDLRRKYMQKRVEQQRAREAKLQGMPAAHENPVQSEAVQTSSADTPISISSHTSTSSTPGLASPPASLRNLLNGSPDSA